MATRGKNLSLYDKKSFPSAKEMKMGVVVSDWNREITHKLMDGALHTLLDLGAEEKNIMIKHVPGSFELTLGAQFLAEYSDVDAVICLGCIIQGETKHFDFICQGVTKGITDLNLKYNFPFIFGILTTQNQQQAKDRTGGKHGNKGVEAALTAVRMVAMQNEMKKYESDPFFLN